MHQELIDSLKSHKDLPSLLKEHPKLRSDRTFFLALLRAKKMEDDSIALFDQSVQTDKELVLQLVDTWPYHLSFKHLPASMRADKDVAFKAFLGNSGVIEAFEKILLEDDAWMMDLVGASHPYTPILQHLPERYAQNKEFVLLLLKKQYQSFPFVSARLRADEDVVWMGMFGSGTWYAPLECFPAAEPSIKSNKAFVARALEEVKSFRDKKQIIDAIKSEHKVALAAQKGAAAGAAAKAKADLKAFKKRFEKHDNWEHTSLLKEFATFCSNDLKAFGADSAMMLLGLECEFSDRFLYDVKGSCVLSVCTLLSDRAFCQRALEKTNGKVYPLLPDAFKNEAAFVLECFYESWRPEWLASSLRKDSTLMLSLLERYPHHYNVKNIIYGDLFEDKEFMSRALEHNGSLLESASDAIKKDKDLVKKAMNSFRNALSYAHASVQADEDLMCASIQMEGTSFLRDLSLEQRANKALLMRLGAAAGDRAQTLRDLMRVSAPALRSDKEFVMMCVSVSGWALDGVDESLKYDKDVLAAAFKTGCHVYKELDPKKLKALYSEKDLKKMAGNLYEYIK